MRSHTTFVKVFLLSCIFCLASLAARAQEAQQSKSWLFVQTASKYQVEGNSITIPYEREIFAFTDRPSRQHRYLNAHEFTALWSGGDDDFSQDPPNAVLTWVADREIQEAEIELIAAQVDDQGLSIIYQFQFEAGHKLPARTQQVSLFVDGGTTEALEFICHINDGEFCRR